MIKHIVFSISRMKPGAHQRPKTSLRPRRCWLGLMGRVPTLQSMHAGSNAVQSGSAWDFALVAEFEDAEALRQYVEHPEHRKVSEFMSAVRSARASVDFEF